MIPIESILTALGTRVRTARELQGALGVSQSTIWRMLEDAGDAVLQLGRGRATRYVAVRDIAGAGMALPIFRIDADGNAEEIARLRHGADGRWYVETNVDERWLRGHDGSGAYEDLPWFVQDLHPSGFLGRDIARRMARALQLPPRPQDWSYAQLLTFLLHAGEIMPGNLLVGRGSASRALRPAEQVVTDAETEYPVLAAMAAAGNSTGSSAAGEQPKFTAYREGSGAVLVKFSPPDNNAVARRWRDLLVAEHHALATLRGAGLPAARTRLLFSAGRVFLESTRFDRAGRSGRLPAFSLDVVDAEFAGTGGSWYQAARALRTAGLLPSGDADTVAQLQAFGDLIGNTDMHFGNLSLAPAAAGFRLLPVYDMLPMTLAPRQGELPPTNAFHPQLRENLPVDERHVQQLAARFWLAVAGDTRCSDDFRELARSLIDALATS
jgi:hypothetical protein